jgi:hypothetical protein
MVTRLRSEADDVNPMPSDFVQSGEILCVGGTCVLRLRSRHRKLQLPVLGDRERHKVREVWRLGTVTGRTEVPLPGT